MLNERLHLAIKWQTFLVWFTSVQKCWSWKKWSPEVCFTKGGVWENIQSNAASGINMDTCVRSEPRPHVKFLSHVEKVCRDFTVLAYLRSFDRKYAICVYGAGGEACQSSAVKICPPSVHKPSCISVWQLRDHRTAWRTSQYSKKHRLSLVNQTNEQNFHTLQRQVIRMDEAWEKNSNYDVNNIHNRGDSRLEMRNYPCYLT